MTDRSLVNSKYIIFAVVLWLPLTLQAFPIAVSGTGLSVIVTSTDDIIATYRGNSAAYSNDLYLDSPGGPIFIFNNHASAVGSTVNLGSFDIGTELLFRLHVNDTGYDFFTGPASRNPDGKAHARVQENWMPNETLVSFEDLFNGPFHYNDLSFSFTNVTAAPVPVPAAVWLFGSGLAGLLGFKRKKGCS
jgi:hypothetical protein